MTVSGQALLTATGQILLSAHTRRRLLRRNCGVADTTPWVASP